MDIQFCGAAREVTGSAHLITLSDGYKILLDCGLYQGNDKEMERFNEEWLFDPASIDTVILSHAHIDHAGRLPKLVKDGFKGKIYATHATRSLCGIMLLDSARIQERDAFYEQKNGNHNVKELYTPADVENTMNKFVGLSYDTWYEVTEGVKMIYRDAGHILGSASIALEIEEHGKLKRIGFTGDIGRPNRPILRDPHPMTQVDYLICESTYGDREHETAPQEIDKFLDIINQVCVQQKGKLIIPAFSVGRTQEIVYMLDKLENANQLPKVPVYVDSPLAVNATMIFGAHPECFDNHLHEYMLKDPNPFGFNSLFYIKEVEDSKKLNHIKDPCIIISASGMMNAGRVKHHLYNTLNNPKNGLLIVGYCAPYTPGGVIRSGAKEVRLFNELVPINAKVFEMDSFSAHADRTEMYDFISKQKGNLKTLFLVHGTLDRQEEFKTYLGEKGFNKIEIPRLGDTFRV